MLGEPVPDLVSTAIESTIASNLDPPSGANNMADTRK